MSDNTTVLMRRMGMKSEKVGWFGHKSQFVLDGVCGDAEVLCSVQKDGANARVVSVDKNGSFADGQVPMDGELLFAVRRTPFYFDMAISAGKDTDGFEWFFDVGGMLEIRKPEVFAAKFRGVAEWNKPLCVDAFESSLGTIPSTVMHDKVTMDVLGVMSLEDKGADEQYADIRKSLEAWRSTNEAFVTSVIDAAFGSFFGTERVASLDVSSFHARSAMREDAIAAEKAEHEKEIARAKAAHDAALAKEQAEHEASIARENAERLAAEEQKADEEKKAAEIRDREHKLKLAELDKKIAALSGPRPEIRMKTRVHVQGRNYNTRDLFPDTTTTFAKKLSPVPGPHSSSSVRPVNRLSIGDVVALELSSNINGWLHLFNYGTSGNVYQLVPGTYSRLDDGRIYANQTYFADNGGDLICVPLKESGPTTAETGYMERFIAIITKCPVDISTELVKRLFDKRNNSKSNDEPLEVAVASLLNLPPEDWVQGTLELEVV